MIGQAFLVDLFWGEGGGPEEDVLVVDEEISAIGAIAGAHERPVCLIEIQMTVLVGRLY